MSVTVTAQKTVGFRSPYIGDTFQELTQKILGRDGYLSGGVTTDDAVNITVGPVAFVQGGLVAETEVSSAAFAVPTGAEPWFIVAAVPDDDPVSGVLFSVTRDLVSAINGTIIAFKTQGIWQNPVSADVVGAGAKAAESGVEDGVVPFFTLSGDNMDEMRLNRGRIVDPDGIRRDLPRETGESAKTFGVTPVRPHASKGRQDYIVLRQRESFSPEVKHIIGGLFDDSSYPVVSKTGTRMAYYAKRGGAIGEQWFAFGSGTALKIQGGPAGESFAEATLLTGSGTIGEVWIAGQRAADDAIIMLYTDGDNVRMVSFDASTGAQIDAPVTIDTQANTCKRIRAELDVTEQVHVVYEHDEGTTPSQQIIYTRRASAAANFADAAITPRIVNGSNTGKNDTWPDVAVDRLGNAHIVYTTGTTTDEFGDLVYAVIDQSGTLATNDTHLVASTVGEQASATDNLGFVSTAYTSIKMARVTVTEFDEVYAAMVADEGSGFDQTLMFSPGFNSRLGFPIVNVGLAPGTPYSLDITSNEQGELRLAIVLFVGFTHTITEVGFDTVFAPNGLLGQTFLRSTVVLTPSSSPRLAGTDEDDIIIRRGTIGDVRISHRTGTTGLARVMEVGTVSDSSVAIRSAQHPKDLYLSAFEVPDSGTGIIPEEVIRLSNVRPKRMNYPFLVGIDGDFQGFDAIHEAVRKANERGGEVVVRKGDYRYLWTSFAPGAVQLASGVTLRGEGQVVFDGYQFRIGATGTFSIDNIDGNIVERTASYGSTIREGDVVELTGGSPSGFHRILAVLPPKGSYAGRILLDNSSPGDVVPSGTTVVPYPAGNKIENIAARGTFSTARFQVFNSYQAVLSGLSLFGVYSGGTGAECIDVDGARHPLVDNIDFTQLSGGGSAIGVQLANNFRPIVRAVRCIAGEVDGINVQITNVNPSLSDCSGTKLFNTGGGSRTTPLLLANVDDGDAAGISGTTDIYTNVGNVIKAPIGEQLHIRDANTLVAPGGVKDVPLTDGGTGGDELLVGRNSVLHGLREGKDVRSSKDFAGFYQGCLPTQGVFPQADFALGEVFVDGRHFTVGAISNSSATVAATTYYFYYDAAGALQRTTVSPFGVLNAQAVALIATTNGGNTAWSEFVDMRRFVNNVDRRGPVIVADVDTFQKPTHNASLQGAIRWIAETGAGGAQPEIIITEQLDMTAGEASIEINFQTLGLRSLTIRALGEDAGIKWGQDDHLFNITGLASEAASNAAGQKATLRFHSLLVDSVNVAGPSDKSVFNCLASFFTELVVDNCRTQSNPGFGFNNFVDLGCDADRVVIAENVIDDCRGIGATSACIYGAGGNTVKNLHVFRNTFRNDSFVTAGTHGILLGPAIQNIWVAENSFEPGRDVGAGNQVFEDPIAIWARDMATEAPAVGCRYIVNNVLTHTEFTDVNSDQAIQTLGDASSPFYILHNQIGTEFNGGIMHGSDSSLGSVISGNHVVTSNQASINAIEVDCDKCIVANNYVRVAGADNIGILLLGQDQTVIGNHVEGAGGSGIVTSGLGRALLADNFVEGAFTVQGIFINGPKCVVSGNHLLVNGGVGHGINVSGAGDRSSITGNYVECDDIAMAVTSGGEHLVVTGNFFDSTLGTGAAGSFAAAQCVISGNQFLQENSADSPGTPVVALGGGSNMFTGNIVRAYMGADYGLGPYGRIALDTTADRNCVVGNLFQNKGQSTAKATWKTAGDKCVFVGNNVANEASSSPIYLDDTAPATNSQWGTSGTSPNGANKTT